MNIFFLSENPIQAAEWMVDRHVVKMILESAQLLSTAHRLLDGQEIKVEVKLYEEDGNIIADNVPIALFGIKFHRESTHIAREIE